MQSPPPVPGLLLQLESMAARVNQILLGQEIDWLWRPSAEAWSLTEVACHLRDVEKEVHQYRFQLLISKENAFITGISADEWAEERGYCHQDGEEALSRFLEYRQQTIEMLSSFESTDWERQGRHAFLGQTSMHEILHMVLRHDEIHLDQMNSLLEGIAAEKVGPEHTD